MQKQTTNYQGVTVNLGREQEAFMADVEKLLGYIHSNGYTLRGGELTRIPAQQEIYIADGKSRTANSMHLKRCAIDLFVFKNGKWLKTKGDLQLIGDFWESLGEKNKWGGNWKHFVDAVHFERMV